MSQEMQEWSTRFIGYGGSGEEIAVYKGVGMVQRLDLSDGGKTTHVAIKVNAPKIAFPFKGWLNNEEQAIMDILEEAKNSKRPVSFRIESARKPGVDKSLTMAEISAAHKDQPDKQTVMRLTAVQFADLDEPLVESREALTHIANDPQNEQTKAEPMQRQAAPTPNSIGAVVTSGVTVTTQQLHAVSKAPVTQGVIDNLVATAIVQGMPLDTVFEALGMRLDSNEPREVPSRAFAREEVSWKQYNSDGRLNLGSISAAVSIEQKVVEHLMKAEVVTSDNILDYDVQSLIYRLTEILLGVVDDSQVRAYGEGFKVDRLAGSHIRLRGVLFDTLENIVGFPQVSTAKPKSENPFILSDKTEEMLQEWATQVGDIVAARFLTIASAYAQVALPAPRPDFITEIPVPEGDSGELSGEEEVEKLKKLWAREGEGLEIGNLTNIMRLTLGDHVVRNLPKSQVAAFAKFYTKKGKLRMAIDYLIATS